MDITETKVMDTEVVSIELELDIRSLTNVSLSENIKKQTCYHFHVYVFYPSNIKTSKDDRPLKRFTTATREFVCFFYLKFCYRLSYF